MPTWQGLDRMMRKPGVLDHPWVVRHLSMEGDFECNLVELLHKLSNKILSTPLLSSDC